MDKRKKNIGCDASPAARPFRDKAQPVCHVSTSCGSLRSYSTLFFLNFSLQHTAEVFNLLVESLFFFHGNKCFDCL